MKTIFELKQKIAELLKDVSNIESALNIIKKKEKLEEINKQISTTINWDDVKMFAKISKEKAFLENIIKDFETNKAEVENINDLLQLPEKELDNEIIDDIERNIATLSIKIKEMKTKSLFKSKNDSCNAFLEINSGSGGTESQDWAEMLLRMYSMWCENKKFGFEIIDKIYGEEAGIKSATIHITGNFAYGLLKNETGTHRLVRISPFNANGKRQTSFAGVFCYPEVNDEIEIEINPSDLKIDVYRSSGAGGQHVNKTESAVRITHIPTGIVCACQTQRSQIQNKENAMKMLKSKLYELEENKKNAEKQAIEDAKSDISWGNQIRNYVLHPYKMVKDLRSGFENNNATDVLNGNLDDIIESVLVKNENK